MTAREYGDRCIYGDGARFNTDAEAEMHYAMHDAWEAK